MPTVTTDRVREDLITSGIGYAAGLGALLMWPLRDTANQDVVFLAGIVILVVTAVVMETWIYKRRPAVGWGCVQLDTLGRTS